MHVICTLFVYSWSEFHLSHILWPINAEKQVIPWGSHRFCCYYITLCIWFLWQTTVFVRLVDLCCTKKEHFPLNLTQQEFTDSINNLHLTFLNSLQHFKYACKMFIYAWRRHMTLAGYSFRLSRGFGSCFCNPCVFILLP